MIGHVAPEAALGGPIALVAEGDEIEIDVDRKALDLLVDPATPGGPARRAGRRPPPRYTGGVFAKYAALVSSASEGASRPAPGCGPRSRPLRADREHAPQPTAALLPAAVQGKPAHRMGAVPGGEDDPPCARPRREGRDLRRVIAMILAPVGIPTLMTIVVFAAEPLYRRTGA